MSNTDITPAEPILDNVPVIINTVVYFGVFIGMFGMVFMLTSAMGKGLEKI